MVLLPRPHGLALARPLDLKACRLSRAAGSFTIVLETKVEIREAAVWSQLDRALTKIGGRLPGVPGLGGKEQRGQQAGGEEEEDAEYEEFGGEEGECAGRIARVPLDCLDPLLARPYTPEPAAAAAADEGLAEGAGGVPSDADASPPVSPSTGDPASASGAGGSGKGGRGPFMGALRRKAAKKLRQLAETTATRISRSVWDVGLGREGDSAAPARPTHLLSPPCRLAAGRHCA